MDEDVEFDIDWSSGLRQAPIQIDDNADVLTSVMQYLKEHKHAMRGQREMLENVREKVEQL